MRPGATRPRHTYDTTESRMPYAKSIPSIRQMIASIRWPSPEFHDQRNGIMEKMGHLSNKNTNKSHTNKSHVATRARPLASGRRQPLVRVETVPPRSCVALIGNHMPSAATERPETKPSRKDGCETHL